MFKKILLTIQALILVALFTACDDDTTGPDDGDDDPKVNYLNVEIESMTYSEYTLDQDGNKMEETEHKDSVENQGEVSHSSRQAYEYKYYTDEDNEGEFQEDETRYYSKEENKLYINSDFFINTYAAMSNEFFTIDQLLDFQTEWFLLADASADNGSSWELFKDDVTLNISGFDIDATVTLTVTRDGEEEVQLESTGENYNSHIYLINLNVIAEIPNFDNVEINSETKLWISPDFCVTKERRDPVSYDIPTLSGSETYRIEGKESVLIDYNPKSSGSEN